MVRLVIDHGAYYGTYYRRLYGAYGALYSRYIWRFIYTAIKIHVSAYKPF